MNLELICRCFNSGFTPKDIEDHYGIDASFEFEFLRKRYGYKSIPEVELFFGITEREYEKYKQNA